MKAAIGSFPHGRHGNHPHTLPVLDSHRVSGRSGRHTFGLSCCAYFLHSTHCLAVSQASEARRLWVGKQHCLVGPLPKLASASWLARNTAHIMVLCMACQRPYQVLFELLWPQTTVRDMFYVTAKHKYTDVLLGNSEIRVSCEDTYPFKWCFYFIAFYSYYCRYACVTQMWIILTLSYSQGKREASDNIPSEVQYQTQSSPCELKSTVKFLVLQWQVGNS